MKKKNQHIKFTISKLCIAFSFLMVTLLFSCRNQTSTAQNSPSAPEIINPDKTKEDTYEEFMVERLDPIRAYVKSLDNPNREWSLVLKKETHFSSEGGEAIFYNWNGKLQKVEAISFGEMGQVNAKYYLKNDTLVFVYEKVLQYNRPIYQDEKRMKDLGDTEFFDLEKSEVIETESYFENGKLIRSIDNQDCRAPYNQEYRDMEQKRLHKEFKRLKAAYNSPIR